MATKNSHKQPEELLAQLKILTPGHAEALERLDGFLAALHCARDITQPSQLIFELLRYAELNANEEIECHKCHENLVKVIMPYWTDVGKRLSDEEVFYPALFCENEEGSYPGNVWAKGFLSGMEFHNGDWTELLNSEIPACFMIPVFILALEHSSNPKLCALFSSEHITPAQREQCLAMLAVSVRLILSESSIS
ncbi:MAG: UPF0149 family protein [Sedimenticola sp.]